MVSAWTLRTADGLLNVICMVILFIGEYGSAGEDYPLTGEEKHGSRQTQASVPFPSQASFPGR